VPPGDRQSRIASGEIVHARSGRRSPTCDAEGGGVTVGAVAESPRLPWRTIAASTVLALLAAGATVVLLSDDADDGDEEATTPITLVPEKDVPTFDEATFTTFEGEEVPLTTVRGTPTVVNFFSSTCTPCITEMPAFEAVYQDVKDTDEVAFLGLAVADRTDDALSLVDQTGVTYPTAEDKDSSVISALGGTLLPTTVLLDADGNVVSSHAGELTADELRSLLIGELDVDL
jgi:thiol-disulfide isomerase/thioredoxin